MIVKIKKLHPDAIVPQYANPGDAGLDLVAVNQYEENDQYIEFGTGISVEIPKGYVGLVFPRSSISKQDLHLTNSVGVIDSSYRGEIKFRFRRDVRINNFIDVYKRTTGQEYRSLEIINMCYNRWDKIGQLIIIPYPQIEFEEVDELSNTDRGTGGYGSTGK